MKINERMKGRIETLLKMKRKCLKGGKNQRKEEEVRDGLRD